MKSHLNQFLVRIAILFLFSFPILAHGKSAKYYYKLAVTASDSLRYENAILLLDSALLLKPKYKKALLTRGELKYQLGSYSDALKDFETLLGFNSMNLNSHVLLSKVLIKIGRYDEAIEHIDYCVKMNPNLAEPHMYRGDIYLLEGDCESAAVKYVVAQKKFKRLDGILLRKARVYAELGKTCLAIKYYNLVIEKYPDDVNLIFERAEFILFNQGIKDSRNEFIRLLSIDSSNFEAALNAGIGYLAEHKFEDAISYFSLAIKINSLAYKAYYNRAFCNYQLGAEKQLVLNDLLLALKIFSRYTPALEMVDFINNGNITEYTKLIISTRDVTYFFDELLFDTHANRLNFLKGCQSGFQTETHGTTILNRWTTWEDE